MIPKTAQQIQDDIFKNMSTQKKAELIGGFWRAAQVLQKLRTQNSYGDGYKRTVDQSSRQT